MGPAIFQESLAGVGPRSEAHFDLLPDGRGLHMAQPNIFSDFTEAYQQLWVASDDTIDQFHKHV